MGLNNGEMLDNFGDFMVIIENYEDLLGFHGIYGKVLI
jgi:hypothetical protein